MKWYLNICATLAGLVVAHHFGLLQLVWESDQTKMTSVIALVWLISTFITGWEISKESKFQKKNDSELFYSDLIPIRKVTLIKFFSETCAVLGMIGTILGFILMVNTSELGDATSTAALKQSIQTMLGGFGIAMFTTLVGAIAKLSIDSQIVHQT